MTSKFLFNAIIEKCRDLLQSVYLVTADTTAVNTGEKYGINKRLEQFFIHYMVRDIHVLECLPYVNES